MTDFNVALTPGRVEDGVVNVVVEIPTGSSHKIEWDRERALFKLDRVEPQIFSKPMNYGFIPQTLDEDGDELDAMVITDEPLATGVVVEGKVIGVLKFIDSDEVDDKVLVVPADDRNTGDNIKSIDDLSPQFLRQLEFHFAHYKDLKKPGTTKVEGVEGYESAIEVIRAAVERWNNK